MRFSIKKSQGIYDEINHESLPDIGHSARKAFRQLNSNEKKLRLNREAKNQNNDFFHEMIDTGHLEKVHVSYQFLLFGKYFILPHHAVWKSDSTTLKRRALFSGSTPTSNGRSLKDYYWLVPSGSQTSSTSWSGSDSTKLPYLATSSRCTGKYNNTPKTEIGKHS